MKIVIDISEEDYKSIKDDVQKFLSMPSHKVPVLYEAVNKGTPLTANVLKEDIHERKTESKKV